MVKYVYDAWGVHIVSGSLATTVGAVNPFRYRSYFYDVETGLYYLKTRYYDPELCRFISMDSIEYADHETINGLNLYAYCNNNPVMGVDPNGTKWWHWVAAAAVVAVLAVATVVSAGSVTGAMLAVANVVNGVAAASTATTVLASATVASAMALTASAVASTINAAEVGFSTGSVSKAFDSIEDDGATVLANTVSAGVTSACYTYSHTPLKPKKPKKHVETGNYIIKNGKNKVRYTGVGSRQRMQKSLRAKSKIESGLTAEFRPANNRTLEFVREALYINDYGGPISMGGSLLNKINSPGLKYLFWWL